MPAILFSSSDTAGKNIADKLISLFGFAPAEPINGYPCWKRGDVLLVDLPQRGVFIDSLELPVDCYIYASRHSSETGTPCLTTHAPGNWSAEAADLGGKPREICTAPASKMKVALRELAKGAKERLSEWLVCMEVTHHGPLVSKPAMFVEIGSNDAEWKNEAAGEIAASAIMAAIESTETFPACFGIGGPHYGPLFTRVMLETEYAVGHVLPKYRLDAVDFFAFRQGVQRCVEKPEFALLDWKGMNSAQREKAQNWARMCGLACRRASDLLKGGEE